MGESFLFRNLFQSTFFRDTLYVQYICETYNSRPKQEDGCEESDTSDIMTLMDIGLIVIFGLCFPTWDVYSDIGLAITLIQPRCYNPPTIFAYGTRHNHTLNGKRS